MISKIVKKLKDNSFRENFKKTIRIYKNFGFKGIVEELKETNKELNEKECKELPLIMKSKPILVYAEVSSECNMCCVMCGRSFHKINKEDSGLMSLDIFKRGVEILSKGTILSLFGRGETLLNPNYPEMLKLAKEKGAIVGFNSNGKLLTKEIAQKMVEYGQDSLVISFSAGTKSLYEKIHRGGSYDNLIQNIKELNEIKKRNNSLTPFLAFEFVAMRQNIEELPKLVELASSLNITNILVIHLTAHNKYMEENELLKQEKFEKITEEFFEKSKELADKLGVSLTLPDHYNPYTKKLSWDKEEINKIEKEHKDKRLLCLEPWQTFYIKFNGQVMPCVITNRPLGDLTKEDALEIWNGKLYQRFRERMISNNPPPECSICHLLPENRTYNVKMGDKSLYESL